MKKIIIILLLVSILSTILIFANDGDSHGVVFPVWTYYAEIVEHSFMIIISIIAIVFLKREYNKHDNKIKQGIHWMIIGLTIFVIAQLLTNLHHFLIYPFGIWNTVIHHGLYLVSIVIMLLAFFKVLGKVRK